MCVCVTHDKYDFLISEKKMSKLSYVYQHDIRDKMLSLHDFKPTNKYLTHFLTACACVRLRPGWSEPVERWGSL